MILLSREFHFDAAHYIKGYDGKCEELHGHTYKLTITISGEIAFNGMVLDFSIIKDIVEENILKKLDHKDLNSLFENPTTENIALWIYEVLKKKFQEHKCNLFEITLYEGINNRVTIR